jgi:hypothetical protein
MSFFKKCFQPASRALDSLTNLLPGTGPKIWACSHHPGVWTNLAIRLFCEKILRIAGQWAS